MIEGGEASSRCRVVRFRRGESDCWLRGTASSRVWKHGFEASRVPNKPESMVPSEHVRVLNKRHSTAATHQSASRL